MDKVIDPSWADVWSYLDDIIVTSGTFENHLKRVEEVVKRIQSSDSRSTAKSQNSVVPKSNT